MTKGNPVSPFVYTEIGIQVQVHFDNVTFELINPAMTGSRDVSCPWSQVQIGNKLFAIPLGSFQVGRQQMNNQGFVTISDVLDATFTLVK